MGLVTWSRVGILLPSAQAAKGPARDAGCELRKRYISYSAYHKLRQRVAAHICQPLEPCCIHPLNIVTSRGGGLTPHRHPVTGWIAAHRIM